MVGKGSILIVDDKLGPRESLRIILKPLYKIHSVSSGQEAINFVAQYTVEVVTLELCLPGMSGIEVLREIKRFQPKTEIIIVTGYGTSTNALEAVRYGAADFICKPFNVADVMTSVSKAFERRSGKMKARGNAEQIQSIHSLLSRERSVLKADTSYHPPFTHFSF